MSDNIMIHINLVSGDLQIQAPTESLETVFNRLEAFLPNMVSVREQLSTVDVKNHKSDSTTQNATENPDESNEKQNIGMHTSSQGRKKPSKKTATSKKPESYKLVDLGINQQQRIDLAGFYEKIKPRNQNQQVLVVMYWLKNNANKDSVTKEEIFTALKTAKAKVPARIGSVLSNLSIDGRIIREGDGYKLHHTGEDYVSIDLLQKEE